jgi:tripartite ATP-independent transporter DctM subunit
MSVETGFWGMGLLLVLLILRVPVALALVSVSFGGIAWLIGMTPALGILANTPYSFVASWTMSAVPMFLLMGFVAYHADLTAGLFDAAKAVLRRIPGALAIASILACSGFASVCGSSLATAASMGRIAIPEMVRAGYSPSVAAGAIAAGGTIGALIPPSILMILYGIFAETSITAVFLGGITIGLLTAVGYSVVVLLLAWMRPDLVPRRPIEEEPVTPRQALARVWPVLLLIGIVFGGLFSALFTATEAGAIGAAGAIVCAALVGRLNLKVMQQALLETLMTTASLLIIGIGAAMFTRFLGITGLSSFIAGQVGAAEIGYHHLMLVIVIVYLRRTVSRDAPEAFPTMSVLAPTMWRRVSSAAAASRALQASRIAWCSATALRHSVGQVEHQPHVALDEVAGLLDHRQEIRLAAVAVEAGVELPVEIAPARGIGLDREGVAVAPAPPAATASVIVRHRHRDHRGLDQRAELEDLLDLVVRERGDHHALEPLRDHQPLRLEPLHRLAHRDARDVEHLRDRILPQRLALGGVRRG